MDLIITVGTNPLPNFVVAYHFSEAEGFGVERIFLVHSDTSSDSSHSSTRSQAESVRDLLKEKTGKNICTLVPIKEVSGEEIYESLQSQFSEYSPRNSVHLNYTGGTKAMAVQVYSFVKDEFGENASSSYLDARNHELKYSRSFFNTIEDSRTVKSLSDITLSIEELLALHGYSIVQKPDVTTDDRFIEALAVIREIIKKKGVEVILEFQQNYVRKIYYDSKGDVIKKPSQFRKHMSFEPQKNLSTTIPQDLLRIIRAMPESSILVDNEGNIALPDEQIRNKDFERRVTKRAEFLGGFWFEQLINELVGDYAKKMKLQHGFSLKARRENLPDFQLDAFLIKGYRLLAISVTTSPSKSLCKSKGFEVIHRSRQIGGDESRSILVTLMNQTVARDLQAELQVESGSSSDSFVVLDRSNYKDIGNYIDRLFR